MCKYNSKEEQTMKAIAKFIVRATFAAFVTGVAVSLAGCEPNPNYAPPSFNPEQCNDPAYAPYCHN